MRWGGWISGGVEEWRGTKARLGKTSIGARCADWNRQVPHSGGPTKSKPRGVRPTYFQTPSTPDIATKFSLRGNLFLNGGIQHAVTALVCVRLFTAQVLMTALTVERRGRAANLGWVACWRFSGQTRNTQLAFHNSEQDTLIRWLHVLA